MHSRSSSRPAHVLGRADFRAKPEMSAQSAGSRGSGVRPPPKRGMFGAEQHPKRCSAQCRVSKRHASTEPHALARALNINRRGIVTQNLT